MTKNKQKKVSNIYEGWGTQPIATIAVNNEFIFTGYTTGKVVKWDKTTGNLIKVLEKRGPKIKELKMSNCRNFLFILYRRNNIITIWNIEKNSRKLFDWDVNAGNISLNDKNLFVAKKNFIEEIDIHNQKTKTLMVASDKYHRGPITALAACKRFLISGGKRGDVVIWSLKSKFPRLCKSNIDDVTSLAIADDQETFFVADNSGEVRKNTMKGNTLKFINKRNYNPITVLTIHQENLFGLEQIKDETKLHQWNISGDEKIITMPETWQGFAMISDKTNLFIAAGSKIIKQ